MKKVYLVTKVVEYHDKIVRTHEKVYKSKKKADEYIDSKPKDFSVYYTLGILDYDKS